MVSLPHQLSGLISSQISPTKLNNTKIPKKRVITIKAAVIIPGVAAVKDPVTIERARLKQIFKNAYERCHNTPMDGIAFTLDDFHAALDKYEFTYQLGAKVKGTVFRTDENGALIDIMAKSAAYLPLQEASIHSINHVAEAGIVPGMREEFVVIGVNEYDDSLVLSLRTIQNELAWERCRQLQDEDVVVKGKVISANIGGVVTVIEGLRGFVPFSQIFSRLSAEDLLEKELPLKFVEVDEENSTLVLSNRQAMSDSQEQLNVGSVVLGTVQIVKPYGAFIDIGGINGLLHISQITHARISDIKTILQPGDILKVMILRHDRERGRVSLCTKKLEPTPGDMIRNPKRVFEKAEEMGQAFRQRIAQAEAMAKADLSKSTLNSGGDGQDLHDYSSSG